MPEAQAESDLGARIDLQIRASGPISLATYMQLCLDHPQKGYYRAGDPFGAEGDFVTAPEISQLFGEMVGAFVADLYAQMGTPERITVFELGPGRGTLMADALRVATRVPGLREALSLRLMEINPDLRAQQARALAPYAPEWIEGFEDLPSEAPVIVIANEFFDAFPVRQFVRRGNTWHERCVGLDGEGRRVFGLSPTPFAADLMPRAVRDAEDGAVVEIATAASRTMEEIARAVAPRGGAVLALDYGYPHTRTGETLQALARHAHVDPLAAPGTADITTHVDFAALRAAGESAGLVAAPLADQGDFLHALGIAQRRDALAAANPERADSIEAGYHRLVAPDAMGTLFKALCLASPGLRPAGFAQGDHDAPAL